MYIHESPSAVPLPLPVALGQVGSGPQVPDIQVGQEPSQVLEVHVKIVDGPPKPASHVYACTSPSLNPVPLPVALEQTGAEPQLPAKHDGQEPAQSPKELHVCVVLDPEKPSSHV